MSGPRLISFEGIDGSGKTTQARRLAERLRGRGREVVLTREPGGSDGAEAIRGLLLSGAPGRWSAETETLLFTAARRDHLERVITPALTRGADVITDRFADSTRVYQGVARGSELRALVDLLHAQVIGREPDLTLIIDLDPEDALPRTAGRDSRDESRFESMGLGFQQRLAEGFRALADEYPARVQLIDGRGAADEVAARVARAVEGAA